MAKKYLFEDTDKPTVNDNLKFKKRANAPSSDYVLGRVIYNNGQYEGIQHLAHIKDHSGISRALEVDTRYNGVSFSNMPKMGGSKPLSIVTEGGSRVLEDWFNRVENRLYSYMSDVVLLILKTGTNRFIRCYGLKDAWPSALSSSGMGTENQENWSLNITLEHSGIKAIYIAHELNFYTTDEIPETGPIDNLRNKTYIADDKDFYADKIGNTNDYYNMDNFFFRYT